jgi:hypothetical protein
MFWFALAAQLSPPVAHNLRRFSPGDVPAEFRTGGSKIAVTRTTVRPDGTVQGCVTEDSSGDPKLDAYSCDLIVKHAKFEPAKWIDGSLVYGVLRLPFIWTFRNISRTEDEALDVSAADLALSVNRLPKGAHSPVGISLEIAVDENGRLVTCLQNPAAAKIDRRQRYPELGSIGCQHAMASLPVSAAIDESGKAVRSVQTASVYFKIEQ